MFALRCIIRSPIRAVRLRMEYHPSPSITVSPAPYASRRPCALRSPVALRLSPSRYWSRIPFPSCGASAPYSRAKRGMEQYMSFRQSLRPKNDCAICSLSLSDSPFLPAQRKALKTIIAHLQAQALRLAPYSKETGYPTYSAGGRGASATGLGIPARGGIAQTGAEASRRACGRYSDPSHAAAHAHGCAILRRKRNHRRSGDAPKCRRRARATVDSTDPQRQTHRCEKRWSAKRTTPKAIS